eukprot:TRINITY_DN5992_c0_g2_i1.p1 TRINITY_DN5992_c0_g2~~TRINITY_DN5992_c0_g2_i1.p1  ORF type:complete len:280 (-),score=13.99 TRINITY_DN5992_c0_g2_i1:133-972(-)
MFVGCCVVVACSMLVSVATNASCGDVRDYESNALGSFDLPRNLTSQYRRRFLNFLSEMVVVDARGDHIGTWTSIWFPCIYSFLSFQNSSGATLLEVREPWWSMFSLGESYLLRHCQSSTHDYRIDEDFWGTPWISFGSQRLFHITDLHAHTLVASVSVSKSISSSSMFVWHLISFPPWHASFWRETDEWQTTSYTPLAEIFQESQWEAGFSFPLWSMFNRSPLSIPNVVVSFVPCIFDIDTGSKYGIIVCAVVYKFLLSVLRWIVCTVGKRSDVSMATY